VQVYHLSETLGFAGQFASEANFDLIVDTILEWHGETWHSCTGGKPRLQMVQQSGTVSRAQVRKTAAALVRGLAACGLFHRARGAGSGAGGSVPDNRGFN